MASTFNGITHRGVTLGGGGYEVGVTSQKFTNDDFVRQISQRVEGVVKENLKLRAKRNLKEPFLVT